MYVKPFGGAVVAHLETKTACKSQPGAVLLTSILTDFALSYNSSLAFDNR